MKKLIVSILGLMLVFAGSAIAGPWDGCEGSGCAPGTSYTWTETYNAYPDIKLSATGVKSTSFTLDITNNAIPFEVGVDKILSADLMISLYDDNDYSAESVTVKIDGTNLNDEYWWTFNAFGGAVSATGLASLNEDGKLFTVVTATQGDFWFDKAELTANGCNNAVPEPATMLLLGFGLVGLAGVRRKFQK